MKKIIGIVLAVVGIVLLVNPAILPLPADTVAAIQEITKSNMPFANGNHIQAANILVAVLAIFVVVGLTEALKLIIEKVGKKNNRAETVSVLLLSVVKYLSVILGVCWVLSILGMNVAAIFASLGVVALIIGFGAQSLIEDVITGMFIIFEGQYSLGDIIILDDFRGSVKRIGVRTTTIEDTGGNLKVVNNSDIRNFQNRSMNPSYATILVDVSYDTDLRYVEEVLAEAFPKMAEERSNLYIDTPKLFGVEDLGASGVQLKIGVHCTEENIFGSCRALRRDVKLLFDEKGIEIPFTQIVLHNAKD